ncbi:MFS transporter [Cellulomonas xylanilytica]|uniref:MFS transporter n=1 Tax=Cellulomonas xylanilytica TaxID=233583 RepID=A0A510V165_9CELL|nr:MFS transporter [Cellulomonas xylanilytica]GEK20653.1 MFS transporter [Cellulomonas xylanilytica]
MSDWRELRTTTWSMVALIFMVAFESLAVTTVMPTVSDALDGASLYAFAFAGPLATGVVGMVLAGPWSDRSGPRTPLLVAVGLFTAGILVAGAAPSMELLVAGRLLQGFGGGAMTVALYVVVARLYPPMLHPRVFAWFAAAWIIPSLVGPAGAGAVAQHVGWRWVFLGVALLVVPTTLMLVPALRRIGPPQSPGEPAPRGRLPWAALAAAAVLGLNLAAQVRLPWSVLVAVGTGVVALVALRAVVPAGTLRAARGLPSVVATRGLVSGAFLGAEVYLPYLLTERYAFSPTTAGIALTFAGVAWAATSWLQGRLGDRLPHRTAVVAGSLLVVVGVAGVLVTAAGHLPPVVAISSWAVAGAGMGLVYSRLTVLVLAWSLPGTQGVNSSALSIADSIGAALALALTALAFAAADAGPDSPFVAALAVAVLFALGAAAVGPRVGAGRRQAEGSTDDAESSALRS